jgi:uncharacterized RDD family membrane protein YckC
VAVLLATGVFCVWLFSLAGLGGLGAGVSLVFWFGLSWFYGGLFETFWNGQTPGKWLLGLRVLTIDGQPINALQAVLRNVLREIDAMPIIGTAGGELGIPLYMLGLAVMTMNDRFQRLGDLASGTIVVVEQRSRLRGLQPIAEQAAIELSQQFPPTITLHRGVTQAITAYVTRRKLFSPARRYEIARILAEPLAERLGLPAEVDPDWVLCALYYHTFIADRFAHDADPHTSESQLAEVGGS